MTDQGDGSERPLILDEIDQTFGAFLALRRSDEGAANELLSNVGADSKVDRQIILELASPRPLGHLDRFPSAHALTMRALEVLDRNASRGISFRGFGPARPAAEFLVQLVTQFIVRSHLARVIDELGRLYMRREANCLPRDPALGVLRRSRKHTDQLRAGYRRNPLGLPTFLLGGAVLSGVLQLGLTGGELAFSSVTSWVITQVILFATLGIAAFVVLQGAGIARRRIHLTLDQPLLALYQTIGRCGEPPKDQARLFAIVSLVIATLAAFAIPIGLIVTWVVSRL